MHVITIHFARVTKIDVFTKDPGPNLRSQDGSETYVEKSKVGLCQEVGWEEGENPGRLRRTYLFHQNWYVPISHVTRWIKVAEILTYFKHPLKSFLINQKTENPSAELAIYVLQVCAFANKLEIEKIFQS